MRDEGDYLTRSVEETIRVAEATGVRTQIAHFKALGRRNWGKAGEAA